MFPSLVFSGEPDGGGELVDVRMLSGFPETCGGSVMSDESPDEMLVRFRRILGTIRQAGVGNRAWLKRCMRESLPNLSEWEYADLDAEIDRLPAVSWGAGHGH
jgi:hypothetical protein